MAWVGLGWLGLAWVEYLVVPLCVCISSKSITNEILAIVPRFRIALPAIWAFEIRAGKDIWADMGDYWGLSGNKEKTRYFW